MSALNVSEGAVERHQPVHEIIEEQVEAYRRLLVLAKGKQEALVSGDVAALEAAVTGEKALLRTLGWLELRYSEACAALGRANGLRPGEVRDRLGEILDPREGSLAVAGLKELAEIAAQLSFVIQANSELIRRARAFVDFSIGQLGRMSSGPVYDQTGAVLPPSRDAGPAGVSKRV